MKTDMTVKDLAKLTGIGEPTLRRLAVAGRLAGAYRIGHKWLINREEFEKHRNGHGAVSQKATHQKAS